MNTPLEVLRYPGLSLQDKARLALLTLRAKNTDVGLLEDIPAELYVRKHLADSLYTAFFEPLLRSKFGDSRSEISAAWLMSRIAIRSDRGISGERLGYLDGGFHQLINALCASVEKHGGTIRLQQPAASLSRENGGWAINGTRFDAVLATITPQELVRAGGPPMHSIPYQGAACLILAMDRDVTQGIYWLNMKDAAPYGAVVTHTNFMPFEQYGEHLVYLASYFSGRVQPRLDRIMLEDFCSRFSVAQSEIRWHRMAVDPCTGPVYKTGYRALIPGYEQSGLFLAGMYSDTNYPERSMEGSVKAGMKAAKYIVARSTHGPA